MGKLVRLQKSSPCQEKRRIFLAVLMEFIVKTPKIKYFIIKIYNIYVFVMFEIFYN